MQIIASQMRRLGWISLISFAGLLATGLAQPHANVEGSAFLRQWIPPQYPADLRKEKLEADVVVEFVVDENGRVDKAKVTSSTDPRFNDAALACVREWTFEPAVSGGRKRQTGMIVPILFRADQTGNRKPSINPPVPPRSVELTSAKVIRYAAPVYPPEFAARQLAGSVNIRFTISPEGQVVHHRVLTASSPDLVRPALDALLRSEFSPARQGDARLEGELVAPFEFSPIGFEKPDILAVNGLRIETEPPGPAFTSLPRPLSIVEPVHPFEALLSGRGGVAEIAFSVTNRGGVRGIEILSASGTEFGEALAAAAAHWKFRPAGNADGFAECRLILRHAFVHPGESETASPDLRRLLAKLSPDGEGVGTAANLDDRLTPVWQVSPEAPPDFVADGQSGEATVEFIIDRDGRARFPRIVRSTRPSLGWAAATAVSCWTFERPRRNGEAVDVRVAVPVRFAAP